MTTILKFINDDEALRIATNLEKEGYNFYIEASRRVKSARGKRMFKQLADAEQKHLVHFDDLRAALHAKKGQIPWGEDDELVSAYVRCLVGTGVFTAPGKKSSASKKDISEEQACRIGIQTERDSILFFDEASRLCRDRRGRKMFKGLIDEEKQHLTDLAQHLKHLKSK